MALTEFLTLVCHSMIINLLTKISFSNIITNEIKFSIIQSLKIMNFYNINNLQQLEYYKTNNNDNIISRMIIKNELFLHMNRYQYYLQNEILPDFQPKYFYNIFKFNINLLDFDNNLRTTLYEIN